MFGLYYGNSYLKNVIFAAQNLFHEWKNDFHTHLSKKINFSTESKLVYYLSVVVLDVILNIIIFVKDILDFLGKNNFSTLFNRKFNSLKKKCLSFLMKIVQFLSGIKLKFFVQKFFY